MNELVTGLIIAGIAIFGGWMGWVSNKTIKNSEKINDLLLNHKQKDNAVEALKEEFEKVERRMNDSLDRFDKRLAAFISTELEELKSIIQNAREIRDKTK